ncbi:Exosortase EpsH-like protein, partial [Natronorubrum tibetense GA33]
MNMSPASAAIDAVSVAGLEAAGATLTPAVVGSMGLTDLLAWVAIAAFLVALILRWQGVPEPARHLAMGAWLTFGVFWLTMVP